MTAPKTGSIAELYIVSTKRGAPEAREAVDLQAGLGIVGDRYHAKSRKKREDGEAVADNHLSLVDKAVLEDFLAKQAPGSDLGLGDFRRSVITQGIDLNALVGKDFLVGTARCHGVELCEPCAFLAATVHRDVLPKLVGRGGLRAIILEDGSAVIGSEVAAL